MIADEEEENTQRKDFAKKDSVETQEDINLLGSQSKIQPLQNDNNGSDEEIVIDEFDDYDDDFADFMFS